MTEYPETAVGGFARPPQEITRPVGTVRIDSISKTDEEVEALIAMYEDFDPADRAQGIPPIGRDRIEAWLDNVLGEGVDVIAAQDGGILGHATLVSDGNGEYELAIFVHQDHRRQGIGSAMLGVLLGAAADAGIEYVWLSVERWNTGAIKLYESVGFETCDSGSFELEMALRLAP